MSIFSGSYNYPRMNLVVINTDNIGSFFEYNIWVFLFTIMYLYVLPFQWCGVHPSPYFFFTSTLNVPSTTLILMMVDM